MVATVFHDVGRDEGWQRKEVEEEQEQEKNWKKKNSKKNWKKRKKMKNSWIIIIPVIPI
eukprot:m.74110 g.74110  ORF g.74110 m.74110 type:complete len:59 (-) comp8439_c1_seq2:1087-1263(-)